MVNSDHYYYSHTSHTRLALTLLWQYLNLYVPVHFHAGLTRRDMISLALLLGCDYCPQGVPGVGKEGALKLIGACKSHDKSCDIMDIMRGWRDGTRSEDMSKIETQIRRYIDFTGKRCYM